MDRPPSRWNIDRALDERNFAYLSELIARQDLAADVRAHLANVVLGLLTGKIKFPPHRRKSPRTLSDQLEIGNRVYQLKWQGVKKPTAIAADEFQCSISKVEQCCKVHRAALKHYGDEKRRDDYLWEMHYETRADAALECLKEEHGEREFSDDEIEGKAKELDEAWANFDDY